MLYLNHLLAFCQFKALLTEYSIILISSWFKTMLLMYLQQLRASLGRSGFAASSEKPNW